MATDASARPAEEIRNLNGKRAADITDLTTSVGTFSATIPDVGAAFNQATLNNIVKSLATQLNSITAALRTAKVIGVDSAVALG